LAAESLWLTLKMRVDQGHQRHKLDLEWRDPMVPPHGQLHFSGLDTDGKNHDDYRTCAKTGAEALCPPTNPDGGLPAGDSPAITAVAVDECP
jgi:hypothetical protein